MSGLCADELPVQTALVATLHFKYFVHIRSRKGSPKNNKGTGQKQERKNNVGCQKCVCPPKATAPRLAAAACKGYLHEAGRCGHEALHQRIHLWGQKGSDRHCKLSLLMCHKAVMPKGASTACTPSDRSKFPACAGRCAGGAQGKTTAQAACTGSAQALRWMSCAAPAHSLRSGLRTSILLRTSCAHPAHTLRRCLHT